jgi:hypothetical protein
MMSVTKRILFVCGLASNALLIGGHAVTADQSVAPRLEESVAGRAIESVFRKYDPLRIKIPIDSKDVELLMGGNIKVDSYNVRNAVRLTKGIDDQVNQWRQRVEVGVQSNFGKEAHGGRAVVESRVAIGGTLFWRSGLTKNYGLLEAANKQDYINPPVDAFINEAWVCLNLDTLNETLIPTPHSLKAGYFPFLVGRGLSLGDRAYGGITYMGFSRQGIQTTMPKYAPGVLLHGEFPEKFLSYDLYYSPFVSEDVNAFVLADGKSTHITDKDKQNAHGRHVVAGSFTYLLEPTKNATVQIEPYFVYYNSQRQTVSGPADAPMYFTTYGMMVDGAIGPVKCNLEVASQYGRQDVLPWQYKLGETREFHPKYKIKLAGSMLVFDLAYHVKDYPVVPSLSMGYFSGGDYPYNDTVNQFHAGQGGFSTLVQSQQATDSQKDKVFKGFIPLRDWGYRGMWCNPLIMFSAGVVPRPVDIDISLLESFNDQDCATNLMFLGFGATWYPLQIRKQLAVSSGMFFHWEANAPHKWDVGALQPGLLSDSGSVVLQAPSFGVVGWSTNQRASSFLGTELNMIVDYQIAPDCTLSVRGGIFFPGQLYADLTGAPNLNSMVQKDTFTYASTGIPTVATVVTNSGLGTSPAYGLYTRMSYVF